MRRTSRFVSLTVLLGLLGAAIAIGWVTLSGDGVRIIPRLHPGFLPLLAAITAFNVVVRFLRWHFLLRRVDVRIPTRASLSIYLASLAAIATPAYAGEIVRSAFIKRQFGAPFSRTLPVLIAERGLDLFALAVIGSVTATSRLVFALMLGGVVMVIGVVWAMGRLGRHTAITAPAIGQLTSRRALLPAAILSMLAWVPAGGLVSLAAASMGEWVPLVTGAQIFSRATLLGGISLMPAGIGATGSVAILGLQDAGVDLGTAISLVSVLRMATTGLTLAVGIPLFVAAMRRARTTRVTNVVDHFDEIADVYGSQLPLHIRDLLVTRKTQLIHRRLAESSVPMVTGLDFGCGHGAHSLALGRLGYRVIGADPSLRAVASARGAGATVVAGSGLELPFGDQTFDFVFAIGVLHHLPAVTARLRAFQEIRRVLKPHGQLLIHETNPRNPIFRFYMGYVFPIIRRIDEGTEEWLDPKEQQVPGMLWVRTDYATFLPDFVPPSVLRFVLALERRLEISRWKQYAAHYLAVFRVLPAD